MGRLKEFEHTQALEKAIHLFWEKGYAHTSLQELLNTMGIQNGSLYNTFGGKKNLFMLALERYEKDFKQKREMLFNSKGTFKKKIRTLYAHVIDRQETSCPKGCFLFNSVAASTLEDKKLRQQVNKGIEDFQHFLSSQMQLAIDEGELSKTLSADITASLLITHMQGLMNRCVLVKETQQFKQETEQFLVALGL